MSDEPTESRLATALRSLKPKTKQPVSATVLNNWITRAESKLGQDAKGGRLGWLVASSVAIAAVQRAVDADGRQLFLLKGGTLLQHRLKVRLAVLPLLDLDVGRWELAGHLLLRAPNRLAGRGVADVNRLVPTGHEDRNSSCQPGGGY